MCWVVIIAFTTFLITTCLNFDLASVVFITFLSGLITILVESFINILYDSHK